MSHNSLESCRVGLAPAQPLSRLPMFDVELEASTGYSCAARIFARTKQEAEQRATLRFPELKVTGFTVEVEL